MAPMLGCIADDFTGATDLAGLLARSGQAVSLRIGVPDGPPETAAGIEVIALKSRTAPVADAVAECRAALAWLQAAGTQRFFWKYCSTFDSTPDGNIGPVAEALMHDTGATQTVYCPAFPENGRSIFMGHLFVGRDPLDESPMRDHPLTPMRDSSLMRLLEPQVSGKVGLVDHLTVARGASAIRSELKRLAHDNVAHVVIDAVANDDLSVIAEACQNMQLMTGGSAVAAPLPALYARNSNASSVAPTPFPTLPPGAVVLSGSCSAMTRAQVAAYLETGAPGYRLSPAELAQDGAGAALDWLAAQSPESAPILYATAEPDEVRAAQRDLGVAEAGALVEDALAQLAVAARDMGAARVVVAGGETSGAVTQALGIRRLDVRREIAPGVPWCLCESAGKPIAITLKSGNFGSEQFFCEALAMVDSL